MKRHDLQPRNRRSLEPAWPLIWSRRPRLPQKPRPQLRRTEKARYTRDSSPDSSSSPVRHHRNRRSKAAIQTELRDISGVGKASAEKLLRHYKTVKAVKAAPLVDLINVVGKAVAGKVYLHYQDPSHGLDE